MGGRAVRAVLDELGVNPDTVLGDPRGGAGHARDAPGRRRRDRGSAGHLRRSGMKCNRCRGPAVIEVRRHNAAYCKDCFIHVFHEQVKRAIRQHDMFAAGDRILVAISGGKDSLALWDVLLDLGYDVTGLYLGLGIGGYSDRSGDVTEGVRGRTRRGAHRRGPGARLRLRHPDGRPEGVAIDVRGLRAVEAVRVQPRRPRGRVRRDRHRPQPRRRGGDAAGQHAPLADRVHRPPDAGPARERGHGEEGQAAVPALGAGDRRVRVPAGHRLRGGGVSARGRQHAAPVQGRHERHRVDVARDEGAVLPGVPGAGPAAVHGRRRCRALRL